MSRLGANILSQDHFQSEKNGVKAPGRGEMTSYVEVHGRCYMIQIVGVAVF